MERITYKNTSKKELAVFVEPDAEQFTLPPGQEMMIFVEHARPKYEDAFALEHDGDVLTIHQPRQSYLHIFINGDLVFYSSPNRPTWEY